MPHHVTNAGMIEGRLLHHRDRSVYLNAQFEHAERY
jgi:hypothetical protein